MLVGVVGKANVGKSTFFKALTLAEVEIANYPFATIKPNSGVGYVKVECAEKQFNVKCNPREGFCINGTRFVPVQVIDVAGLVPGAHEGKGMGNQFLDDLRQADVLIHVIDVAGTTNEKGEPVEPGSYDPAEDIKFLEVEIDMWYFGILKKGWEKFVRRVMQEKQPITEALAVQLGAMKVNEDMVDDVISKLGLNKEKPNEWSGEDIKNMAIDFRKRTKPMVIACNKIDIPGAAENFARLETEFPDHMLIACSAESELALREAAKHELIEYIPGEADFTVKESSNLSEKQGRALEFIRENILKKYKTTGVQQVIDRAVFDLLKYMAVFPGGMHKLEDSEGRVLPDCFLLPEKSTALEFAYKIHTDLGDNFIKAMDVKKKVPVGKDHVLHHGDVIEIVARK
jgi:ribosome-binding ATPase YchF (GTP1/OBG family)